MSPERAEGLPRRIRRGGKGFGEQEHLGSGVDDLGGCRGDRPEAASVAVVMRGTQNAPGKPADIAVLALRVALAKAGGKWLVADVTPINAR